MSDGPFFDFSDMPEWPAWQRVERDWWIYDETLLAGFHVEIMALPLRSQPVVQAAVFERIAETENGRVVMQRFDSMVNETVPYDGEDEREAVMASMRDKAQEYVAQYQNKRS